MHVTIVGAGALGRVYGVRLASGTTRVDFWVRPSRATEARPFVLEQLNGSRRRDTLAAPSRVASLAPETQIVLLAVHVDHLDAVAALLAPQLAGARLAKVVTLTPLLPHRREALERTLGRPTLAAMPSVAGYIDDHDVVRYFVPRVATTLLEGGEPIVEELARRLCDVGLPARLEREVGAINAATTIAFFPFIAAVGLAGSVQAALDDKALLSDAIDSAKECDALSHRVGKPAGWVSLLTRFVGPFTLKPAVSMARKIAPEAVRFVEAHFGPKLAGQHAAMGTEIVALAKERGVPVPHLERLLARRAPSA